MQVTRRSFGRRGRRTRQGLRSRRVGIAAAVAAAFVCGPALAALATAPSAPAPLPTAGACSVPTGAWPEYQGDPTHAANACSGLDASTVTSLRPAWFFPTKGAVTDTPAVAFGSVFAGDYSGLFYALGRTTGSTEWTFDTTKAWGCFRDAPGLHADTHKAGFGQIPASPATATIDGRPTVYVAAGGSLFALDAASGKCIWAQDTDPGSPKSSIEIESSPVVDTALHTALHRPEVLVGNDDNSGSGVGVTGLMAFDAATGELLWKYEPERDLTLTPGQFGGSEALTLSCGDGSPNQYCTPAHIADLAPNDAAHADACGDVWSSPALDTVFADPQGYNSFEGSGTTAPPGWYPKQITKDGQANPPGRPDGLVVFGTGNCAANPDPAAALGHGDYVDNQGIFALDPVTGVRVWNFVEPYNQYDNNPAEPGDGDDDFGSSAIIAHLPAGSVPATACPPDSDGATTMVIEGSKAGFAYGLCAANGGKVWAVQAAQPGQLSADYVGALGGFIGSPSMGLSNGRPTVFFTSAVPTPLSNDGFRQPGDGDSNLASCPGLAPAPLLPACPDLGILQDPQRTASLHAVDAATGAVEYQAPAPPTYAASTYTNGVVFMPDSLAAGVAAFDANTGRPLWAFPLAAVPASAAAIAGPSIFLGTGETDSTLAGQTVPPQLTGIWSFTAGAAGPVPQPVGGSRA
ncbi:MAG TPA: PQQ-binding-like beta-propeller repeat protein [Acidimicrobiales bacterium]|nr:PQQ-binding-like beta-propeller repeat protein [Acidimicrobiales bacterium]